MPRLFPDSISFFARTNARSRSIPFGIKQRDRLSHMYVIGKTGTGKSTLLETLISQDIERGEGLALLDPHGDLVERVAAAVPEGRRDDVLYCNVPDPNQPYGYNPLRHVRPELRSLAASGLLEVLKMRWKDAWGVRMEHILRHALLALLDQPRATLGDILQLLTSRSFRRQALKYVTNPQVAEFWTTEYEKYAPRLRAEAIAPIQNKVGAFLADPTLRRILTEPVQELRIRQAMDEGKIVLINLAKGRLGEDSASLLGGLLVTTIGLAAFSRADVPEETRRPFFVYLDEFQNFTTLSLATMTSELRKFGVGLLLAHQYLDQLEPEIRHAVLGNAGTLVSFRLGAKDASHIAHEFKPVFTDSDIMNLPNYHIYLKLMIDGEPSKPFSAVTLPPSSMSWSQISQGVREA